MNVFAKFDEIPSMILQDIKEKKRYGRKVGITKGNIAKSEQSSHTPGGSHQRPYHFNWKEK